MRLGSLLLSLALAASAAADDTRLLQDEQRDALQRQQQELRDREQALAEQARTASALLQQQQAYIDWLRAQLDTLQETRSGNE